jgi:hypothetical protein
MKRTTRKENGIKKRDIRRKRRSRKQKKSGGNAIKERIFFDIQSPHMSNWPVFKIHAKETGNFADLLNKFIGDNIHKVENGLNSVMLYENNYPLGLNRPYFQRIVYLGQELPEHLSDGEKKKPELLVAEIKELKKIQKDPHYQKELEDWIQFYTKYISEPVDGNTPVDEKLLIQLLNKELPENMDLDKITPIFTTWEKPTSPRHMLLEIAKLARISWHIKYQIYSPVEYSVPITIHSMPSKT